MAHTLTTFKPLLAQLVLSISVPKPPSGTFRDPAAPLTDAQLHELLAHLTDATFTGNPQHHAAIGSALTALRMAGLDTAPRTLAFMRETLLQLATPITLPATKPSAASSYSGFVDMVGTGGDGKDTFNVSTTASFVAAGVEGMHVCKHGGRASSSTSGSAELLISLGIPLLDVAPDALATLLGELRCTFLFAPKFHSAMAPLAPIRASLGFPTLFNILGPLINPARPARGVYGVHSSGLGQTYADALRLAGMDRVWVVCGQEGLDEISPSGPTDVWEVYDGTVTHKVIAPSDFGLPTHPLEDVRCGTAAQNASVVVRFFTNPMPPEDKPLDAPLSVEADVPGLTLEPIPAGVNLGAIYDYTLIQAASALYIAGFGDGNLVQCTQLARESMRAGHAHASLCALREAMHNAKTPA
ncbi:anthranilate phosphoribosyltransferase [Malassezia brasiliensis]|uniref:Anthranilate phosphoribosyltransferase n=1 Tax=Malassezia brasiliensis TaxID=1821822 RepID=A0AAF0INS6_9BASI|nr:anthranilate phosphoribosyltransferase [Malassezia brasiliensis]